MTKSESIKILQVAGAGYVANYISQRVSKSAGILKKLAVLVSTGHSVQFASFSHVLMIDGAAIRYPVLEAATIKNGEVVFVDVPLTEEELENQKRREIVKNGVCPECGSRLARNSSMAGWWQCSAYNKCHYQFFITD